ncbi:MAG: DMT family transporter [Nocardioides sp.]|uniref:DMT family transporter n=1 Tax=Nocardioides sp. TaxID=35761 RepID=UPI0039E50191
MTAIVLALVSALAYGTSDFIGGLLSGRVSAWTVAWFGQLAGAASAALIGLVAGGAPTGADLAWAAVAGIGSGVGCGYLYQGLSTGRMGVVAPISGVGAAIVPVVAGVLGGERPAVLAWAGIVLALPAIWLVAREPGRPDAKVSGSVAAGVLDGVVAGAGFGMSFALMGQVGGGAGAWPTAVNLLTATVVVTAMALVLRQPWLPRSARVWPAIFTGILGALALVLFVEATQHGFLAITGVITSLYPAATIALATLVLREPVHRAQAFGMALCAAAVALVATG